MLFNIFLHKNHSSTAKLVQLRSWSILTLENHPKLNYTTIIVTTQYLHSYKYKSI